MDRVWVRGGGSELCVLVRGRSRPRRRAEYTAAFDLTFAHPKSSSPRVSARFDTHARFDCRPRVRCDPT